MGSHGEPILHQALCTLSSGNHGEPRGEPILHQALCTLSSGNHGEPRGNQSSTKRYLHAILWGTTSSAFTVVWGVLGYHSSSKRYLHAIRYRGAWRCSGGDVGNSPEFRRPFAVPLKSKIILIIFILDQVCYIKKKNNNILFVKKRKKHRANYKFQSKKKITCSERPGRKFPFSEI